MNPLLLSLFVVFAFAHPQNPFEACVADKQMFCPDANTHELVHQCMQQNYAKLSAGCTHAIQMYTQRYAVFQACNEDRIKFCSSANSHIEVVECMRKSWASLSQKCHDAIHDAHDHHTQQPGHVAHEEAHHEEAHHEEAHHEEAHHEEVHHEEAHGETNSAEKPHQENTEHVACPMKTCSGDLQRLCPSANNREMVRDCLKTHWTGLSVECQQAIIAVVKAHNGAQEHNNGAQEHNSVTVEFRPHQIEVHPLEETPLLGRHDGHYENVHTEDVHIRDWKFWLVRVWWTYPVGLVLLIQLMACFRIRQLHNADKKAAAAAAELN